MKRSFPIVALLSILAAAAFAADAPAPSDRDVLLAELRRTESHFLSSIEGLTDAQWNYKAAPDRWSIAECAEHIAAAESFLRPLIAESTKKTLAPDVLGSAHKDEILKKGLVDRTQKFKAPEPIMPTNRFGTPAAAVEAFRKARAETIALAAGDFDLRTQGDTHFIFGPLDANGWFLFLSGHSERHTLQIEEVKAAPGYPK